MRTRKLFVLLIMMLFGVSSTVIASEKSIMKSGMMEMEEASGDGDLEGGMKALKSKMDDMKETVEETADEGVEKVKEMVLGEISADDDKAEGNSAVESSAPSYSIDLSHSTLGFAVKHMVVGTTRGSFGEYNGIIQFDPENDDAFRSEVTIDASGIDTKNEKRDEHLRSADFFDVVNHPEIKFTSSKLERRDSGPVIIGELTMKGVTKELSIPVEIAGPVKSPYGMDVIGINGSVVINRQDFDISWSKNLDTGGLIVADDVKLVIELEAQNK